MKFSETVVRKRPRKMKRKKCNLSKKVDMDEYSKKQTGNSFFVDNTTNCAFDSDEVCN